MQVKEVCRKLIKPCIPTPENLKNYKLSIIDAIMPTMNLGILLFFPSTAKPISHLEESLAKILAQFYPLAGRYIKEDHSVDCSDEGAEFVEAEAVDVELTDLVQNIKAEQLNVLLPRQSYKVDDASTDPLLSIQITQLKCGGLVIGISISHRVFDASSVGTFLAAWSIASNPGLARKIKISPNFDAPSLFPYANLHIGPDDPSLPSKSEDHDKIVVKRLSFNKEAITSLISKLRPSDGKGSVKISRVRVVFALIARALMRADRAKHGKSRACLILLLVNLRERTIPPLPKHSCGNLTTLSLAKRMPATTDETEGIGIEELVYLLGDAIDKTTADCARLLSIGWDGDDSVNDDLKTMSKELQNGEVNVLWFSDCSRFGLHEADFGWGKPAWAGIGPMPTEQMTVLTDSREGDAIEAWVHLNQNDIPYFEEVQEIRSFTT